MDSQVKFYARNTYMKGINMTGYVFDSDFRYSRIEESSFYNAIFDNCDISCTTFNNVSFKGAYLCRLVTDVTNFLKCDFTKARMNNFTFDTCVFRNCDFSRCDMTNVTFKCCSFYGCNFKEADLPPFFYPSMMEDCINVPYMPMACPEEGEFIGYKIASSVQMPAMSGSFMPYDNKGSANVLVTLKIPADARRSSAGGRKCRCDKAKVIGLEFLGKFEDPNVAYSMFDARFKYRAREEISVPDFNENRWDECSKGIHFFINRKEALQYYNLMGAYYGRKQC